MGDDTRQIHGDSNPLNNSYTLLMITIFQRPKLLKIRVGTCDREQMLWPLPVISYHCIPRTYSSGSLEPFSCQFLVDPTRRFGENTAMHGIANQCTKPKLKRKMTGWREKKNCNSYDTGNMSLLSRSCSITLGVSPSQGKRTLRGFS